MAKIEKNIVKELIITDADTGDSQTVGVEYRQTYYIPKSLNVKVRDMSMGSKMAYICRGSEDIKVFWHILSLLDENNSFENPSKIAHDVGWDNPRMSRFIKRGIEAGMWMRSGRGKYWVDPYTYAGRRVRNQRVIELQEKYPVWNVVM